ncbi:MAG: molecular chaperone DnaK [bacterium JZ-2024 1]
MAKYIVGIDFGTTTSLIAVVREGKPTLIPNEQGSFITPSVVGISEAGTLLVGEPAKNQMVAYPERTVASVKRLMGSERTITLGDKEFTPQEIAGVILKKLKLDAENYLGTIIEEAVLSVPAYFTDAQRQAVKDAGEIAGFKIERIINEPTAAALGYGFDRFESKTVLVYDLGGGTFDVSVIRAIEGAFKVLASSGNSHLGGDDFDWRIVDYLVAEFDRTEGVNLKEWPDENRRRIIMQRLKDAAEKAKIDLSTLLETTVSLPFLVTVGAEPKHLNISLTRARFEELVSDLVEATREPVRIALQDARLRMEDVDDVILVGGSTRMPIVQRFVREFMGKEPAKGVNPEEVVALGAAVQAGIKAGELEELVIVDVSPFSLGIEVIGDRFSTIIPRNSTIPASRKRVYVTTEDYQTEAHIHVLQGESEIASQNVSLGEFILTGIEPKPKGEALVEVQFDYDINGMVRVTARDRTTGAQKSIVVKTTTRRLSKEEVRRAQVEVGGYTSSLLAQRARTQAAQDAEGVLFQAEAFIRDRRQFLTPEILTSLEKMVNDLRVAIDSGNDADIKKLKDRLLLGLSDAELMVQG